MNAMKPQSKLKPTKTLWLQATSVHLDLDPDQMQSSSSNFVYDFGHFGLLIGKKELDR